VKDFAWAENESLDVTDRGSCEGVSDGVKCVFVVEMFLERVRRLRDAVFVDDGGS
jgi:hypothetical protein